MIKTNNLPNLTSVAVIILAVFALFAFVQSVEAAMTKGQVKAATEKTYDVRVLKINPDKKDGKDVFIVKVMYNGGNWNTAFQVNTIVINANTGKRVSQFRHQSSGRSLSGNYDAMPNRQPPDALRRHIWR